MFTDRPSECAFIRIGRIVGPTIAVSELTPAARIDRLITVLSIPPEHADACVSIDVIVARAFVHARATVTFLEVDAAVFIQTARYVANHAHAVERIDPDCRVCKSKHIYVNEKQNIETEQQKAMYVPVVESVHAPAFWHG